MAAVSERNVLEQNDFKIRLDAADQPVCGVSRSKVHSIAAIAAS